MDSELSLGRLLFLLALAVAVVLPVRLWLVEPIYIATGSMEPTLPVGTHLFADKLTLSLRSPRRGDVIVFRPPVGSGEFVKRVIAVPGETVELREKKVFIDGKALEEGYARHTRGGERLVGDNIGPLTVPESAVFVLGDNRDESEDSSVWKDKGGQPVYFLRARDIVGLVRGVF